MSGAERLVGQGPPHGSTCIVTTATCFRALRERLNELLSRHASVPREPTPFGMRRYSPHPSQACHSATRRGVLTFGPVLAFEVDECSVFTLVHCGRPRLQDQDASTRSRRVRR